MGKLVIRILTFGRYVIESIRHRHVYCSRTDLVKVLILHLAMTRVGRRFFSQRLYALQLCVLAHRVYVRSCTSDYGVLTEIFENGTYASIKRWSIPANALIVDLGGNIGLSTLFFTSLFGSSTVIVVEPDRANLRMLIRNCLQLIHSKRVTPILAFVAADDGTASIDRTGDSWTFKKADTTKQNGEKIPCISMPTLLKQYDINTVDLLKCDIEGSEVELLQTCHSWIGCVQHLVVETHYPYSPKELYSDLHRAGWSFDVLKEVDWGAAALCFLEKRRGPHDGDSDYPMETRGYSQMVKHGGD